MNMIGEIKLMKEKKKYINREKMKYMIEKELVGKEWIMNI